MILTSGDGARLELRFSFRDDLVIGINEPFAIHGDSLFRSLRAREGYCEGPDEVYVAQKMVVVSLAGKLLDELTASVDRLKYDWYFRFTDGKGALAQAALTGRTQFGVGDSLIGVVGYPQATPYLTMTVYESERGVPIRPIQFIDLRALMRYPTLEYGDIVAVKRKARKFETIEKIERLREFVDQAKGADIEVLFQKNVDI